PPGQHRRTPGHRRRLIACRTRLAGPARLYIGFRFQITLVGRLPTRNPPKSAQSPERGTVSTPRSLDLSSRVRTIQIRTARGSFAAWGADPAGGIGQRQPALLVPGYTGSKEDFLSILEPLASAGRAVTAIDLRGQYESGPASCRAGYALDQLAADILA